MRIWTSQSSQIRRPFSRTRPPPHTHHTGGFRLRGAREYVGLLQEDVAAALDIPRASVSAIESGKRRVASLELRRLGRLYRRPVAWLLGEEGGEVDMDTPLYRATAALSDQDKEQVLRFAEFLAGAGRPGAARAERTE